MHTHSCSTVETFLSPTVTSDNYTQTDRQWHPHLLRYTGELSC